MNDVIGKFICELRKEKNLTQKDLADKLNITDRAVSKWERGICLPDISILKDLSNILGVTVIELLDGEKSDKTKKNNNDIKIINYAENNIKIIKRNYLNIIMLSFIIFISLTLLFLNIENMYYYELKYPYSVSLGSLDNSYNSEEELIRLVKNKIELINNNQGNYSNDDYQQIKFYLENLNKNNYNKDIVLLSKNYFTFNELFYLSKESSYNSFYDIYIDELLKKNNISFNFSNDYYNYRSYVSNFVTDKFSYYPKFNSDIGYYAYEVILSKYDNYNKLLDEIIKVGEINE